MATFLFDDLVFGPVHSRRLGISLGINLLPTECKVCNFNCIYCECGWTEKPHLIDLPKVNEVIDKLQARLIEMNEKGQKPDVITFAGNGEPTMHPQFKQVVEKVIDTRNKFCPKAKVAVLSNATLLHKKEVAEALKLVDYSILKLDSAIPETLQLLNEPPVGYTLPKVLDNLKQFTGVFYLQTMFLRGKINGISFDNTTENEISAWLEAVKYTNPQQVMIYSIDRDTPASDLQKVSADELNKIAERVRQIGFDVQVSS
jgi:wyosine [tRNA(Phe)-imidazoG37] synthetase (radical SAM superfamily)